eukprot:Nitzschia sp. Nitz4//scaffold85_size83877//77726//79490//NITZ4_005243-RA/size83877-augustus-gene-0.156-mRNA-1//1//CDS//3329559179//4496//frame0
MPLIDVFRREDKASTPSTASSTEADHLDDYVLDLSFPVEDSVSFCQGGKASPWGSSCSRSRSAGSKTSSQQRTTELIEEAFRALSIEEQERVTQDLVGFPNQEVPAKEEPLVDSPQFQTTQLDLFEKELQRLKARSSWSLQLVAIELAEQQNMAFVKDPAFRLRFLATDEWDASQAASRFIRYFDLKLELFGEAKLTKNITLDDLTPEDMKMFKKGYFQVLPQRDNAGRAILFGFYNGQVYETPESVARQMFYMSSARDQPWDSRGIVFVAFKIANLVIANDRTLAASVLVHRLIADMPLKWCVSHKFLEQDLPGNGHLAKVVEAAMYMFQPSVRARTRVHYGSYTEWTYTLMTLGVPSHLIPVTSDLKIKTKNHLEWMGMRKQMEDIAASPAGATVATYDVPSNLSVLLGKGKPIQDFCGNKRLANLIDDYVEQYHNSSKCEKTTLAETIVSKVISYGGQFLTKESGVWIPVTDAMARDKVSHMFRHQRQKVGKTAKQLTGNCSTVRVHEQLDAAPEVRSIGSKRIRV